MVYVAMELIPCEGEILKGIFSDLEDAKSAALLNKSASYHLAKVYKVEVDTPLSSYKDRDDAVVWRERTPTFDK